MHVQLSLGFGRRCSLAMQPILDWLPPCTSLLETFCRRTPIEYKPLGSPESNVLDQGSSPLPGLSTHAQVSRTPFSTPLFQTTKLNEQILSSDTCLHATGLLQLVHVQRIVTPDASFDIRVVHKVHTVTYCTSVAVAPQLVIARWLSCRGTASLTWPRLRRVWTVDGTFQRCPWYSFR